MKTLFKSVLAALAAVFLVGSLSGCLDGDEKTASQGGEASSSVFQSQKEGVIGSDGVRRFYLPAGTSALKIGFKSPGNRDLNKDLVKELLTKSGIEVDDGRSWDARSGRMVEIKPISKRIFVSLPSEVQSVEPFASDGRTLFKWNTADGFVIDYRA